MNRKRNRCAQRVTIQILCTKNIIGLISEKPNMSQSRRYSGGPSYMTIHITLKSEVSYAIKNIFLFKKQKIVVYWYIREQHISFQ